MAKKRPRIPMDVFRAVLTEAGHRCAIPTCRAETTEIHHIKPWSKVKEHKFENLIALCPTCHARVGKGQIDRKSMRIYKANLSLLNSRYSSLELRVLEQFAQNPEHDAVLLPGIYDILILYLLKDGILQCTHGTSGITTGTMTSLKTAITTMGPYPYQLTPKGKELVEHWANSQPLS